MHEEYEYMMQGVPRLEDWTKDPAMNEVGKWDASKIEIIQVV